MEPTVTADGDIAARNNYQKLALTSVGSALMVVGLKVAIGHLHAGIIGMFIRHFYLAWLMPLFGITLVIGSLLMGLRIFLQHRPPTGLNLGVTIVAAGLLLVGFASTWPSWQVHKVRLNSIIQLGLEKNHQGLRGNGMVYSASATETSYVSIPKTSHASINAVIGLFNDVSHVVHNQSVTVPAQGVGYRYLRFDSHTPVVGTQDEQHQTLTLPALPDPKIDPTSIYLTNVNNISVTHGLGDSLMTQNLDLIRTVLRLPSFTVDPKADLTKIKASILQQASGSSMLLNCDKQEIAEQLADAIRLTPDYQHYRIVVPWQTPLPANFACTVPTVTSN